MDPELQPLLVVRAVDEYRPTIAAQLNGAGPKAVTDPCSRVTHEHPRADLRQPLGEVTSKPWRSCCQHEGHHCWSPRIGPVGAGRDRFQLTPQQQVGLRELRIGLDIEQHMYIPDSSGQQPAAHHTITYCASGFCNDVIGS